jgi:hypothetical protein
LETEKFKLKDLLNGLVIPIVVGLLILFFAVILRPFLVNNLPMDNPLPHILTFGFAQMILFGVPLILGLIWNKWAGGAAGFLMGAIYYLSMAGYSSFTYLSYGMTWNFFADASLITYIVVGILIGYMAGALNNGSYSFKRMLGAGIVATISTALIQFMVNYYFALQPNRDMTLGDPAYALFLVLVPNIALGVITPILAKVMTWYGLSPTRH